MAFYGGGGGMTTDGSTTYINSSGALAVKPSSVTQTNTVANITYSTNTTLTADVYCGNCTIDSGVTLTTNGYNIYCTGTFTNNGTINCGSNSSGGTGGGAGPLSFTNSYAGSGGGGGGGSSNGSNGSTPSAPTLTSTLINSWYLKGMANYLQSGGGGGNGQTGGSTVVAGGAAGTGTVSSGATGGSGSYGIYIQAANITAGTINANGGVGTANGQGGGGGGGGAILLAYSGTYSTGTYNVAGGAGVSGSYSGGNGGAGEVLTYLWTVEPVSFGPFVYSTNSVSIHNRASSYNYSVQTTTATTLTSIASQNITPVSSGLIRIRAVVQAYNNTIGDGVTVTLFNGTNQLDTETITQEGLANNPHTIFLYTEQLFTSPFSQQTYSIQFAAVTGGTASCEIQEFTVEEVY